MLGLALMKMSETSFLAARAVRQSTTAVSIKQGINTVLNSVSMCKSAFTGASNANPLQLGKPWVGPTNITKIDFGTETLAEVGQVHGELITDRIVLTKQEGPFDVQVIVPLMPNPVMMQRYTASLTLAQKKASNEATLGGDGMQSSTFYLVLTVDETGKLHDCYGGAQTDIRRDICEQQFDGTWDGSQRPACLIHRMTLSNTFPPAKRRMMPPSLCKP